MYPAPIKHLTKGRVYCIVLKGRPELPEITLDLKRLQNLVEPERRGVETEKPWYCGKHSQDHECPYGMWRLSGPGVWETTVDDADTFLRGMCHALRAYQFLSMPRKKL